MIRTYHLAYLPETFFARRHRSQALGVVRAQGRHHLLLPCIEGGLQLDGEDLSSRLQRIEAVQAAQRAEANV